MRVVVSMAFAGTRSYVFLYLLALAAVSFGVLANSHYDWPDFVHTDYGFPFVWAVHTAVTIVGPTDRWSVNLLNLALNIAVWLSVSFLTTGTLIWKTRQPSKTSP